MMGRAFYYPGGTFYGGRGHAATLARRGQPLAEPVPRALRDELSWNDALPPDLESRIFSYLDELSASRRKNKAARDSRDEETTPPTEPDPAPADAPQS